MGEGNLQASIVEQRGRKARARLVALKTARLKKIHADAMERINNRKNLVQVAHSRSHLVLRIHERRLFAFLRSSVNLSRKPLNRMYNDMLKLKMPIGSDDFYKIRENGYYYADKTKFIYKLLEGGDNVTLITRPRRFGKSLLLSMLQEFFSLDGDASAFQNLEISKHTDLCKQWMNKRPVIFLNLKTAWGSSFQQAKKKFAHSISSSIFPFRIQFQNKKNKIDSIDFDDLNFLSNKRNDIPEDLLEESILTLSRAVYYFYGTKPIFLVDEYDVPLAKAKQYGYYDEMVLFFSHFMNDTLKSNHYIEFSILTGCLHIAKESIYTGVNNFKSFGISDSTYSECCGFTPEEVEKLLLDTGFISYTDKIKEWYDGYIFGQSQKIYNPWDVLNYIRDLRDNPEIDPSNYWENTSENDIIYEAIKNSRIPDRKSIEALLNNRSIKIPLLNRITYRDLDKIDTIWNILYSTGYLTKASHHNDYRQCKNLKSGEVYLAIPNKEIMSLFKKEVEIWNRNIYSDSKEINEFFNAFWDNNSQMVETLLSSMLIRTISCRDYRENFYHGFIAGLFEARGYKVQSNQESGKGYYDIVVIRGNVEKEVAIIEAKWTKVGKSKIATTNTSTMRHDACIALNQIKTEKYITQFQEYKRVLFYGIAFSEKECVVQSEEAQKNLSANPV